MLLYPFFWPLRMLVAALRLSMGGDTTLLLIPRLAGCYKIPDNLC